MEAIVQNQNIQSYAGFTIGPIYNVMSHSKKTKELCTEYPLYIGK